MIVLLELVVALGVVYFLGRITLKALDNHRELKMLREERAARLEVAKTARDIADELLLDKEMAGEVNKRLAEKLRHDSLPPKKTDDQE